MEEQRKIWVELHRVLENEYYRRFGAEERMTWELPTARLIEGDVGNATKAEKAVLESILTKAESQYTEAFLKWTAGSRHGGRVAIRATTPIDYAKESNILYYICD